MRSQAGEEAAPDLWGVSNQAGQLGLGLQEQPAYSPRPGSRGVSGMTTWLGTGRAAITELCVKLVKHRPPCHKLPWAGCA